jgi:hypothetical protein
MNRKSQNLKVDYEDQAPDYTFESSKQNFLTYLADEGYMKSSKSVNSKGPWPEKFEIRFEGEVDGYGSAKIFVAQVGESTVIWLRELMLNYYLVNEKFTSEGDNKSVANEIFESLFVDVVRKGLP